MSDEKTTTTPPQMSTLLEALGTPSTQPTESNLIEGVWTCFGDRFSLAPRVETKLPPGCYKADVTADGRPLLIKQDVATDDLVVVADSTSERLLEEIRNFWEMEGNFKQYGFVHKRGILLAGPPGGGKTVTINLIVNAVIEQYHGIAVYMTSPLKTTNGLKDIRVVEKNRPIVVIIEDIDEIIEMYGESVLLDLLDGGAQIENVVFIATTNYVEKLQDRIVKRPSRFDTVEFVVPPADHIRRAFLKHKVTTLTDGELDQWTELSEGLSFAHLKEMIIMTKCFGRPVEDVVDRLKNGDVREQSVDFVNAKKNPIGFSLEGEPPREKISLKKDFNR